MYLIQQDLFKTFDRLVHFEVLRYSKLLPDSALKKIIQEDLEYILSLIVEANTIDLITS